MQTDLRTTKEILESFEAEDLELMIHAIEWFNDGCACEPWRCDNIKRKLNDLLELQFSYAVCSA